ncbi:MAG: hypothetical protein IPG97_15830 [Microthrixaceae bacterium]|nr:hypothetical protein [Microthrixaceae bacterium]
MNNSDRARIILNIEIAANWLNTIPHDINAIVAEKHRQARAQASIRSGSDGRAPKGSHSDPTTPTRWTREADAALAPTR